MKMPAVGFGSPQSFKTFS